MRLGAAEFRFTTSADGDFAPPPSFDDDGLAQRRRIIADFPWTWLRQVHGVDAVVVTEPGAHKGAAVDAAVAVVPNAPVAVVTADCAPIVLVDDDGGSVAVVHAGWRGLTSGVMAAAVNAMRANGAGVIRAALGPCIHAECYEFVGDDLDVVVERFGPDVRGVTKAGTAALDLPAAVRVALGELGVELAFDADACTSCTPGYWSHRARGDKERQATVAWLA
ncbi:MAG: polyphenol oxidase family protein [Actinobacteria bacterium]|nr:polyphenol oxidase family protein [Actinomycetota bacterium]